MSQFSGKWSVSDFFPPQWYFLRFKAESGYKYTYTGFPGGTVAKNLLASKEDTGLIPMSGKSPGEGNDNPLQYSCLENPMDRGAWRATVHEIAKTHIMHARTLCYTLLLLLLLLSRFSRVRLCAIPTLLYIK